MNQMFLNDLFIIVELNQVDNKLSVAFKLNADHKIFEGHFPDSPVLPGVVQLQIVKEILEQHLQRELQLKNMRTCKFLSVINPVESPVIYLDIKYSQQQFLEVTATGTAAGNIYLKAQISYI